MSARAMRLLAVLLSLSCSACTRYSCGLPEGGKCRSLSSVYAAVTGTTAAVAPAAVVREEGSAPATHPRLAQPRQLRIWVPAWVDADGDLRGEHYLYLRLDDGRWLLAP